MKFTRIQIIFEILPKIVEITETQNPSSFRITTSINSTEMRSFIIGRKGREVEMSIYRQRFTKACKNKSNINCN